MSIEALRETFFVECEELIEQLTEGLESVAGDEWDSETINAIFRAVHSIKGSAGAFGFEDLVGFAHHYETVLDLIRSDRLEIDAEVLRLITRSADILAELVDASQVEGAAPPEAASTLIAELESKANAVKGGGPAAPAAAAEPELTLAPVAAIDIDLPQTSIEGFQIFFEPVAMLYLNGHEPARLFAALAKLGELTVSCNTENLPELPDLDFEGSYLTWTLTLRGTDDEDAVRDVFSFVDGLCRLDITPIEADGGGAPDPADFLAQFLPEEDVKATSSAVTTPPSEDASPAEAPSPKPASKAKPESGKSGGSSAPSTTLRVDPERVDRLINSVGELIINHAVITQKMNANGVSTNSEIMAALDEYRHLARDIQEGVIAIRAQPVKSLFQRMGRVVREVAEATGKPVVFESEGQATEIDKTVLERLVDPLTHMLRNAVDHGIEPTDVRAANGKSEAGTVRLSAAHRSGHVVIEISDDGAGVNREKVLAKAIDKGIVSPDAKLTDAEIDALLFAPGFSTAENVTNLSGRGVGMDVVKTAITSLGGKVGITSVPGEGSTFTISMPLTLAVLDGMIVGVADETMVLPLSSIVESVRPKAGDISEIGSGEFVLSVRGAHVPAVDLGSLMGLRPAAAMSHDRAYVLLDTGSSKIAVSVDAIWDQRQVVIKSLEGNYGSIPGISAATILGDGKIALIIDPDALVSLVGNTASARPMLEMEA